MKNWKKLLSAAVFVLTVCAVTGLAFHVSAKGNSSLITEGVYIGKVYVGGMTEEEAVSAVEAYVREVSQAVFTLEAGDGSITLTAEQMGVFVQSEKAVKEAMAICKSGNLIKRYKDRKDLEQGGKVLPLEFGINKSAVTALLNDNASRLNTEPVNNGLTRENGEFKIVEGKTGVKIDAEESAEMISSYLQDGWDGLDAEITLAADIVEPEGTREQLLRVKDVLGTFHTNYSTSAAGRCTNVELATSKIDGTVLYPGDEFSVGQTINPLDAAHGYELAGSYENGTTVQSYGGGVCQVSTTLYNAVILAELDVTERSNHTMIVSYVKPSMDAAIAGDYMDLKFKNNTAAPIYIEGYTEGKNVYFTIYGEETRPSNRVVSFESEVIASDDPVTQFVATEAPLGTMETAQSKHVGYIAQLWKVVTVDGVVQSREKYNKSTYHASPKIVHIGTSTADPAAAEAINAALASGDEATIYATVGLYAAAAAATGQPAEPPVSPEEQAITGTVNPGDITGAGGQ